MLPLPSHSRRRRAAAAPRQGNQHRLACSVTWLPSAKYICPTLWPRVMQRKKIRLRWQATAAQPGSALTKIAGGHLGEPPPRAGAVSLFIVSLGGRRPRRGPLLKPVGHQNPVKHRCPNKTTLWPCVGAKRRHWPSSSSCAILSAKSSLILLVLA